LKLLFETQRAKPSGRDCPCARADALEPQGGRSTVECQLSRAAVQDPGVWAHAAAEPARFLRGDLHGQVAWFACGWMNLAARSGCREFAQSNLGTGRILERSERHSLMTKSKPVRCMASCRSDVSGSGVQRSVAQSDSASRPPAPAAAATDKQADDKAGRVAAAHSIVPTYRRRRCAGD